jgi:hypothetical protein
VHGLSRQAARQHDIQKGNSHGKWIGDDAFAKADGGEAMSPVSTQSHDPAIPGDATGTVDVITEVRREEALLKTGALQNAIFNSANFSSIATDEKGVIQIFNVGA